MKTNFLLASALIVTLAGCDQKNSAVDDLQRKNAELQSRLEEQERAAKQKAAGELFGKQAAANDEAARKLAADRVALDAEMAKLTAEQKAAVADELTRKQEALKAEEQRIADARAMAVRKDAEARELARTHDARHVADKRTLDLFYDQLDPFGDWIEVEGYGFVFQPTVALKQGWRPYVDGAWVRTDHGWAWKSNEPFGWATYHYGRWIRLNKRGWGWVPDSEWAPAWVAWRWNETFVGWAPLPPEAYSPNGFNSAVDEYYDIGAGSYVFVGLREFLGGNSYVGRLVEPERNAHLVHDTANVTNISYQQVNQQTVVVNEGPSFAVISAAAAEPVPTLRIQRIEAGAPPHEPPPITAAGVLSIFAPALLHEMHSKPKAVKSREPRDVNRGWRDIDADMQARIRERNAVEARQIEERQRAGLPAPPPVPPPRSLPAPPAMMPPVAPPAVPPGVPPIPVIPPPVRSAPVTPPAPPAPIVAPAPKPVVAAPARPPVPVFQPAPVVVPPPVPAPPVQPAPVIAPPRAPLPAIRTPGSPTAPPTVPAPVANPSVPVPAPPPAPVIPVRPTAPPAGVHASPPFVPPSPPQRPGVPAQPVPSAPVPQGKPLPPGVPPPPGSGLRPPLPPNGVGPGGLRRPDAP